MRSEKEIKEEIKDIRKKQEELRQCVAYAFLGIQGDKLDWVLEGEPRYSIADLEKIIETQPVPDILLAKALVHFVKTRKEKAEKILNE